MNHFELFAKNQKRINNISLFILLLATASFIIALVQGNTNIFFQIVKLIVIGIVILNLMNGKKWAVNVTLIITIVSIIQCILGIIYQQGLMKIYFIILMIGFIFIVKFLSDSKGFDVFFKLKNNDFAPNSKEGIGFVELIENKKIEEFEHRKLNTPQLYLELLPKLFAQCNVEKQIITITHKENIFKIETSDTEYELAFNNQQNIFDRNIIKRLNFILEGMESNQLLFFVYPNSILNPDSTKTFIMGSKWKDYSKLLKNGYVLK